MDKRHRQDEHASNAEHAAAWLARIKEGRPEDKSAFLRWLKRSPQNIGETLLATSTDIVLRQYFKNRRIDVESEPRASNVIHVAAGRVTTRRTLPALRKFQALGAGLGLAVAASLVLLIQPGLMDWWREKTYVTSVGEQRTIELADGSSVAINASSRVRVRYSESARDVYLEDGQALFSVAKDPQRPFRVRVGGSIVQAVGTKFDVRRRSGHTRVAVAEGVVGIARDFERSTMTVASRPTLARVSAGEAVSILAPGHITLPTPVRIAEIGLWQQRRLVFADSTLAEIAEEFARYKEQPTLRIEGEALRARRLSGVFDADSPEALLIFFAADPSVEIDRGQTEIIIRARPIGIQRQPGTG
jgi:transmembrane sensor